MQGENETYVELKHEIDEIGIEPKWLNSITRVFCLDSLTSSIVDIFQMELFTQRTSLILFFCEFFQIVNMDFLSPTTKELKENLTIRKELYFERIKG